MLKRCSGQKKIQCTFLLLVALLAPSVVIVLARIVHTPQYPQMTVLYLQGRSLLAFGKDGSASAAPAKRHIVMLSKFPLLSENQGKSINAQQAKINANFDILHDSFKISAIQCLVISGLDYVSKLTHFEVGSAYCVCNGSGINARLGERFKGHQNEEEGSQPPYQCPFKKSYWQNFSRRRSLESNSISTQEVVANHQQNEFMSRPIRKPQ